MIAIADKQRAAELTKDSKALFGLNIGWAKGVAVDHWKRWPCLRGAMDLDDLCQEALCAMHEASLAYTSGSFHAIAGVYIRNRLIDLTAKALRQSKVNRSWEGETGEEQDLPEPDAYDPLFRALGQLSGVQYEMATLRFGLNGRPEMRVCDIAEHLGYSVSYVSKCLSTVRRLLGESLG